MVGSGVLKRNCLHKQTRLFEVTNPGCTSQGSASMNFVSDQINPVAILDQERSSPAYQGFQPTHHPWFHQPCEVVPLKGQLRGEPRGATLHVVEGYHQATGGEYPAGW